MTRRSGFKPLPPVDDQSGADEASSEGEKRYTIDANQGGSTMKTRILYFSAKLVRSGAEAAAWIAK